MRLCCNCKHDHTSRDHSAHLFIIVKFVITTLKTNLALLFALGQCDICFTVLDDVENDKMNAHTFKTKCHS